MSVRTWKIYVSKEVRSPISVPYVRKISRLILNQVHEEIPAFVFELSIVLTTDDSIKILNRNYRKKNKPTDVLSFPQFTPRELQRSQKGDTSHLGTSLGDIVISLETLVTQAERFEVTIQQEFVRLMVHGILHLLGYDHEGVTSAAAQKMRRKERMIRESFKKERF